MPVNPAVVRWAREAIGYSLDDAADKLSISRENLAAWEAGEKQPSFPQLKKISNVYKRISATFFLSQVPTDPAIPKDFRVLNDAERRRLAPSTVAELRDIQRKRNDALELARKLGSEIPTFTLSATLESDIEALAVKLRELFGVTDERQTSFPSDYASFNHWKRAIEDVGVLVFQASLKSLDELRGLAIFHERYPIILLSTKDQVKPRTFSLLHEFGHLLLRVSGIGDMEARGGFSPSEVFCNALAAECLLPKALLTRQPEIASLRAEAQITAELLATLSNRFQVSWEVILRRLTDLGKLSGASYQGYRDSLRKRFAAKAKTVDGGPPYQVRVYSYNGEPFTRLAVTSYLRGLITAPELTRYLGLSFKLIEKMSPEIAGGAGQ
ncbi:ImmA/IrrE family metallo-endopeptidase [Bdellovibrionota bacterium FG-1]